MPPGQTFGDGDDTGAGTRTERPLPPQLRTALGREFGRNASVLLPALAVTFGVGLIAVFTVGLASNKSTGLLGCFIALGGITAAVISYHVMGEVTRDLFANRYVERRGSLRLVHQFGEEGRERYLQTEGRRFDLSLDTAGLVQLAVDLGGAEWSPGKPWQSELLSGWATSRCIGVIAYLEHSGMLLEIRTLGGVVVYRDPRIAPDIDGQSLV
jgi:hypothetical protein